MSQNRKKNTSFNILVKKFLRDHNIPSRKDVEKILTRLDELEKLIAAMAPGPRQQVKKGARFPAGAAAERVLQIIKESDSGAEFAEIRQKTGFDDKKLRNIIFRLKKTEKITTISRGKYAITEPE